MDFDLVGVVGGAEGRCVQKSSRNPMQLENEKHPRMERHRARHLIGCHRSHAHLPLLDNLLALASFTTQVFSKLPTSSLMRELSSITTLASPNHSKTLYFEVNAINLPSP